MRGGVGVRCGERVPEGVKGASATRPRTPGDPLATTAGYHRGLHQTRLRGTSGTHDTVAKCLLCREFAQPCRSAATPTWARLGSNQRPPACERCADGDWRRLEATVERFGVVLQPSVSPPVPRRTHQNSPSESGTTPFQQTATRCYSAVAVTAAAPSHPTPARASRRP
jgi:hypothetical protein